MQWIEPGKDENMKEIAGALEQVLQERDGNCGVTFQRLENFYEVVVQFSGYTYAVALDFHHAEPPVADGQLLAKLQRLGVKVPENTCV